MVSIVCGKCGKSVPAGSVMGDCDRFVCPFNVIKDSHNSTTYGKILKRNREKEKADKDRKVVEFFQKVIYETIEKIRNGDPHPVYKTSDNFEMDVILGISTSIYTSFIANPRHRQIFKDMLKEYGLSFSTLKSEYASRNDKIKTIEFYPYEEPKTINVEKKRTFFEKLFGWNK